MAIDELAIYLFSINVLRIVGCSVLFQDHVVIQITGFIIAGQDCCSVFPCAANPAGIVGTVFAVICFFGNRISSINPETGCNSGLGQSEYGILHTHTAFPGLADKVSRFTFKAIDNRYGIMLLVSGRLRNKIILSAFNAFIIQRFLIHGQHKGELLRCDVGLCIFSYQSGILLQNRRINELAVSSFLANVGFADVILQLMAHVTVFRQTNLSCQRGVQRIKTAHRNYLILRPLTKR